MINILTNIDEYLFVLINAHHTVFFDRLFFIITQFGSGWVAVPLAALVIIIKTPRKFLAKVLICAAVAGLVSGIVNTQIKQVVKRDRPVACFAAQGDTIPVHVVGEVLRRNSFPSGHTNTAFTAAALVAFLFGGWYWSAFGVAALVGFSRVYVGAHFPLDTVAGGVMGTLLALAVIRFFQWQNIIPRGILVKAHDKQ